jgi:hypothetical protein
LKPAEETAMKEGNGGLSGVGVTGMSEQESFERAVEREAGEIAEEVGATFSSAEAASATYSILPSAIRPVSSFGDADAANNAARDPLEAFRVLSGAETLHRRGGDFASAAKRRKHGRKIASGAELEAFAREAGLILDPAPLAEFFATKAVIGGGEHSLFFDEESQRFIKVTKADLYGYHGDDAGAYLERLALSNITFGDDIAFEGIVKLPGEDGFRAVISQPFYPGRDATPEEVIDYLNGLGFHRNKKGGIWTHPVTGISLRDTDTPGNVIALEGGGFQAIDIIASPASAEDLKAARDSTGIKGIGADGTTFSAIPIDGNLENAFEKMFSPFSRSPELRASESRSNPFES